MGNHLKCEHASLDGIAFRMAECASRIKGKITSFGLEAGLADIAAQGIVHGLLNARITGVMNENMFEILEGFLVDDKYLARLRAPYAVPGVNDRRINADLVQDIKALIAFFNSIDLIRVIKVGETPGSIDDGIADIHERFLQKYAPGEKSSRGVFYTPWPVARFIVCLVDALLKEKLGLVDGLADQTPMDGKLAVQVLDPATGTGTFLFHVLDFLEESTYPRIPRLVGIDLMPIPLAIGRMRCNVRMMDPRQPKVGPKGITFIEGNALESGPAEFGGISVIIGNPPYSRASQNKGTRVDALLDDYKVGVKGDRNIQALSDDYVKFIRLGQEIIDRNGFGILAFVVNHTFLRGPIFRGMRRSLMDSFDELYALDLHGNAKIQENVPPGIVDKNVFSIQQGTCIFVALKNGKKEDGGAVIRHHEIFGTRQDKFAWLVSNGLKSIPWCVIHQPREPLLAFSPATASDAVLEEYEAFTSIEEIFNFNSVGGKPGDDGLLVSFDPEEAVNKVEAFVQGTSARSTERGLTEARQKILRNAHRLHIDSRHVIPYNYRPFDTRFAYFDELAWTRPVSRARQQCQESNLVLLTTKLVKDREFNHAFVARAFTDVIFLSNTSSTNCYLFPLCIIAPGGGKPAWNLSRRFREYADGMGAPFDENDLPGTLGYIYAMLWSKSFKQRFGACLKDGAPRIPLIEDKAFHGKLRALGGELVSLHLLDTAKVEIQATCTIDGTGPDVVEKMRDGRFVDRRMHLNPQRFFFPVREKAYDFRVGKYAVLRKWLDDRVGKSLDASEIRRAHCPDRQGHRCSWRLWVVMAFISGGACRARR
jgi:predicted helicase